MEEDVDKLELLINSADKMVKVGEKVMEDGKVDWKDAAYTPELIAASIDFVKALMAYKELAEEVKDLDVLELAELGGMLLGKK